MKRFILLPLLSLALQASPVNTFNTGVDSSHNVLPAGSTDPHYSATSEALAFVLGQTAVLPGTWIPNNSTSQWIGPNTADGDTGTGYSLIYRTTVDLTGFDSSTASITGQWATDNTGVDILINGNSTGQTSGGFDAFSSFAINSGFIDGVNTIDFSWSNISGPGGLRVEFLSADANLAGVPEPGTIGLMLAGVAFLAISRRRR